MGEGLLFLAALFIVCVFAVFFYLCKYPNDKSSKQESGNSEARSGVIDTIKRLVSAIWNFAFFCWGVVLIFIECDAVEDFFDITNSFLDVIFFAFFYISQGVHPIVSIPANIAFPIIGAYTMYHQWHWSLPLTLLFTSPRILVSFLLMLDLIDMIADCPSEKC